MQDEADDLRSQERPETAETFAEDLLDEAIEEVAAGLDKSKRDQAAQNASSQGSGMQSRRIVWLRGNQ
jgi:hypothetical protein